MDVFAHLATGFGVAFQPELLLYCFLGTLFGTAIGVLPGIGPTATIAMLLPMTFGLSPEGSLIMLAGVYYGAAYGGSTTAILVNLPGEAASAVTTLDGYQMARQGKAGVALATAALSSLLAGTVATFVIAFVAEPMTRLAVMFSSADYFSLVLLALVAAIALAAGSIVKALGMICMGLLISLTGLDIYTGAERFTFGFLELQDGYSFVVIAVGIFGISEILRNLETVDVRASVVERITSIWPGREDRRRMFGPAARGTALGSVLGVLPGGGAVMSSFVAYSVEKRISRNPEKFGKGAIEGVAAPEAANNAGSQTSFIPMLSLGIPPNAVMALMLGALLIHGITPGPQVIAQEPKLFWGLIASMWIGNVMLVILNLPLIRIWVALVRIPYGILFPFIVIFCALGGFGINNSTFDVYLVAASGLLGYIFLKLDCEPVPFILGFVLGPLLEEHFRRAMLLSGGDPLVFLTSPLSATMLSLALGILLLSSIPALVNLRRSVFVEDE